MADDEFQAPTAEVGTFDPSKKKKKKKKESSEGDAAAEVADVQEKMGSLAVEDSEVGTVDFGKKKKKKKAQAEGGEAGDGDAADGSEAAAAAAGEGEGEGGEEGEEGGEDLGLKLKKKKKKKVRQEEELAEVESLVKQEEEGGKGDGDGEGVEGEEGEDEDVPEGEEDDGEAQAIELGGPVPYPWEGTDRDYTYEELLGRVFNILRSNNPELAGDRRRTIIRPPQVLREGTKKTVFANFMDLCKTMHRPPDHVMAFLLAELGTDGSLDGQSRLIVKGRFAPKNFEGILRRYINEYVLCTMCKSNDTILTKQQRLFFLNCQQCGSQRSVAPIKAGFVARVGRRKAQKA